MKLEYGSFTPTSNQTTVVLNDFTLEVEKVLFWIDSTYEFHGYDDGTTQVAAYGTGTSTKDDRSIYLHNGSTAIMSGRMTLPDIGEFTVTFDSHTADTINFLVIGS